jgi:AraC-like DNA-binding protein
MRLAEYSTWQGLQRRLLWAYDGQPPAGPGGYSPFVDSGGWLVRAGEARVEMSKQTYVARKGDWLLPPPTGVERQSFSPGTHLLSIRFKLHWPDGRPLFQLPRPLIVRESEFPDLRIAAERLVVQASLLSPGRLNRLPSAPTTLVDFARVEHAFAAMLDAWCAALETLGVGKRVPGDLDPRIAQAIDLIDRTDRPMKQIASLISLSVSQLDRLFLREIGQSPRAYRTGRRLERIRFALRTTDEPIKAIAYREGFKRLSHFSAWFASQTRTSPRAYRSRAIDVDA